MSSKLEEIKTEMIDLVDRAWHALEGTIDVDKARVLAGEVTTALTSKAQDVAEHLFYHVLNNGTPATDGQTDTAVTPSDSTPVVSAPEGGNQTAAEPQTGMAPPAGDPAADTTTGV